MDCAQLRQHVLGSAGGDLPAGAQAHARACEACGALVDDSGRTARALEAAEPTPRGSLAALEAEVERDLARETGVLAWMRSRGRAFRLAVVVTVLALEVMAVLAWSPRPELGGAAPARLLLTVAFFGVLLVAAAWHALRPLYLPPAPSWVARSLVVLGVLAPAAAALLPGAGGVVPTSFLAPAAGCLALGTMLGGALLVIARALDRGGSAALSGALLAAAAAGLAGNLLLGLHCPVGDSAHVLVAHAGVVVVLLAGCVIVVRAGRRPARR